MILLMDISCTVQADFDGFTGAADFNQDGRGEGLLVGGGQVTILSEIVQCWHNGIFRGLERVDHRRLQIMMAMRSQRLVSLTVSITAYLNLMVLCSGLDQ